MPAYCLMHVFIAERCESVNKCECVRHMCARDNNYLRLAEILDIRIFLPLF